MEKDVGKAVKLYQVASDKGHVPAICSLGLCYEIGRGVEKDLDKALELYRKAADAGDARAQCNLGF